MGKDFSGKDFFVSVAPYIAEAVKGKVVLSVEITDVYPENLLKIVFDDGTALVFRYDYIYEWDVVEHD